MYAPYYGYVKEYFWEGKAFPAGRGVENPGFPTLRQLAGKGEFWEGFALPPPPGGGTFSLHGLPYYTGLARRMVHTCLLASLRLTERLALSAAEGVGGVSSLCTKLFGNSAPFPTLPRWGRESGASPPSGGRSGGGRKCKETSFTEQ